METLRGIPRIPTDTIEFVNLCPEKWKCDACGVIVSNLWRNNYVTNTSFTTTTTKNSISYSLSPLTQSIACSHRFCALCLDKIFSGISVETKCPFDSVVLRKKQVREWLCCLCYAFYAVQRLGFPMLFMPQFAIESKVHISFTY